MRAWLFMLGGLVVWAVHFFSIYIVASIFLTSPIARILTGIVTLACLAADALLLSFALRGGEGKADDGLSHWMRKLAVWGAGLSLIAVVWQGLPALLI